MKSEVEELSNSPLIEGWAHNAFRADGTEEIWVKMLIPPELSETERALAIHEGFTTAKTLLISELDVTHH